MNKAKKEYKNLKLSDAIKRFQDETKNKDHVNELSQFNRFIEINGDMFIGEIDRQAINVFIDKRLESGVSKTTINRTLQKVRALLNKAKKEWEVLEGEVPYFKLFTESGNGRVRWLNKQEVSKLASHLPTHTAQMMLFTLETGLRESNVTQLRWNQINFQQGIIYIEGKDILKSDKAFVVPLSDKAIEILQAQKGKHLERVFTYGYRPIKKVSTKLFKKTLVECGIEDFRWHDLRHTWATRHVQKGTPLDVLQKLGGWSDFKSVQRYAHYSYRDLKKYV
jgi:integrase